VTHDSIEGWYVDPFRVHAARWFSDGIPTALVRDKGGVESYDAPPSTTFEGDLERVPESGAASGDDLLRADSVNPAGEIFDPNAATGEF
jgi:hypothetical protein